MNPLPERLREAARGACSCGTASPITQLHRATCRYRLLVEARDRIADLEFLANALRERLEASLRDQDDTPDQDDQP